MRSDNKKDNLEDVLGSLGGTYPVYRRSLGTQYEFYLSGDVASPDNYTEWFDIIRNATPNDEVYIRINSRGGYMSTATQFLRVMAETQAEVTCSIEGDCMSAATMIFLAADRFEITPHSSFMIHNYSGGSIGKGGEIYDQAVFERDWSKQLLDNVYQDFLTKSEIKSLLDGKDIWLHYTDVAKRTTNLANKRNKRAAEAAEQE